VFTSTPLTGNQLAVVHDAGDLDDASMQAFARETRLSETTFVQPATEAGADYRNRIWTMRGEIDFAGHPSLGTAVAIALSRGDRQAQYVQQTNAGLQPCDVEILDDRLARASMLQEPATFGAELELPRTLVPDPDPELPVQVVGTGVAQVIAPVRSLDHPPPPFSELVALLDEHQAVTLYLAVIDGEGARARSYMAEPASTSEDPATGSSAGPLMAYLHQRTGIDRLTIEQGVEMGRPSRMDCAVEGDRVRVGGDAVVALTGRVSF
jgi:trans-2,3-dihydro-3-hydroxyanthranilate isomerase